MLIDALKLDHLRYYVAAVETGSFASAGDHLNVTPTSVAYGVSALENTLGFELLIRKRASGVLPNAQGLRVFKACRRVLLEVEAFANQFVVNPEDLAGELIVGCQEGLTWSIAPRAIELLKKLHPKLSISVKTIFMERELEPLENGEVDMMLTFRGGMLQPDMASKIDTGQVYAKVLCTPNAYALLHADHPLCKPGRTTVSLEELASYPHIFIKDGPAFPLFYQMYERYGLTPNAAMVSNISPGAQSIVGKTKAVSLRIVRPSISVSPLGDKLAYLEITNEVERPDVIVVTHKNSQSGISLKAAAFIDACQIKFDDGTLRENFFY